MKELSNFRIGDFLPSEVFILYRKDNGRIAMWASPDNLTKEFGPLVFPSFKMAQKWNEDIAPVGTYEVSQPLCPYEFICDPAFCDQWKNLWMPSANGSYYALPVDQLLEAMVIEMEKASSKQAR